jgi:hypothetical protein
MLQNSSKNPEPLAAAGVAQLAQGLGLDLTDALARPTSSRVRVRPSSMPKRSSSTFFSRGAMTSISCSFKREKDAASEGSEASCG